jgi:GT2 family glycosyltransferase
VWFPEFLETMVGLAKKNEHCIAVASNYILRRADKDVVAHKEVALNGDIVVNYFSSWLDYKAHLFNGSCILVKREVIVDVGMFPVGVDRGEDLIAWIRLAWTGDIAYCPKPLMAYYLENAGAVHKQRLTALESYPMADVFKRWNRENRIPSHLLPSSIDFVVAHFLYFNKLLCNQEAYGPALRMLLADIGFLKYRKRGISRQLLFVMYNWMKTSIKKSK